MPADVCPHSSKQVANCWCDAKMCLVKQKKTKKQQLLFRSAHWQWLHVFPDTVIRNFKLIWILTAWKCVSETSPAESPKKKNLNVYSRISVKSDRQKTLNPEEGTTNALSTIYQMLHVFFPLNYNLKKKNKKTNSLKWQMCLCKVFLSLSHFKWWKLPPSPATTASESSLQKRP